MCLIGFICAIVAGNVCGTGHPLVFLEFLRMFSNTIEYPTTTRHMTNVTIKDIAKALNLSTSTVSRALRDSYEISAETKQKILDYAQSVNYSPNPIALSLRENKSHSICVIVPQIANPFFSEVINGIDDTAYRRGYHVVIFQTHEQYDREVLNLNSGLARRADGIILSLSGNTACYDHLQGLKSEHIPIVFFDRVPPFEDCHKVVVDNFVGAYEGTRYLIDKGKKRIAHITSPAILSITKERLEGYKACLQDFNIPQEDGLIRFCGFDAEDTIRTIEEMIQAQQPDSFFLGSDRLALYALQAIKKNRHLLHSNPEIVGFSNISYNALLDPPLTIIQQPAFEMGQKAADLLIDSIESKHRPSSFKKLVLKTSILPAQPSAL